MNAKEKILKYLKDKQSVTGKELSEFLGISRQAVNKHLKELINNDHLVKEGTTRGAVYRFASIRKKISGSRRFKKSFFLQGLEEDKVFRELGALLNLNHELSKRATKIAHYGFTEILNNAIDHSFSEKCALDVSLDPYRFNFRIRDFGIGIFYSIFTKFNLPDENAVIGELIKGKTTTMKDKHSGEGIFFTSKAADTIFFRSHKIKLIFDNLKKDVFVEERKFIKGTEVDFSISRHSKRRLDKIFSTFAPEEFDYRFERTRVLVKLFHQNYVSRSEAKRLLYGLDKFSEIILDFEGVKSIAQGFTDEIFRVFSNAHPDINLKIENLSPILEPIIKHVVDNNIK
jgi:anti-sigma regulatory factor (Ser/Thr protein kinase)